MLKVREVLGHSSLFDVVQELSMQRVCQQFKDQGSVSMSHQRLSRLWKLSLWGPPRAAIAAVTGTVTLL